MFFGFRTHCCYRYPKRSVLHANMCRRYSDHHFSPPQSYLMAACIKTIKLCPSPATTIICGCVGWNLARNYHFLNHFTLLARCLFHSFSFSVVSLSSLKDLEPPACSSFCFFSLYFFFIIIQQHFSVRANAFWTASFLPFQAGCHCCCLWAGCIYLGVIGVWMSEVMRCIHTWLLPSLRAWDRRSLAGLRLELYHTAVFLHTGQNGSFIPRWTNTITRADTSMRHL